MRSHRRAAVLSVGDELVLGQALDTNSQWLSQRLLELGVFPQEHATVADDEAAIVDAILRLARGRSADSGADLVVITGGLGPTADDLTRTALAAALGERLVEDPAALAQIRRWFDGRGRPMPEINRVQAQRPMTAESLPNEHGTAPGLAARLTIVPCDVFCLPGPPREMKPMFDAHVVPRLRLPTDRVIVTRSIATFGLGESEVAERLGDLMTRSFNPLVGTTASAGVVTCRVRMEMPAAGSLEAAREAATREVDAVEARIGDLLGPYVLGSGGTGLAGSVVDLLRRASQTLGVVESCTGGLLGAMVTEIPGASTVFVGGLLTYANEAKVSLVGVPGDVVGPGGPGAVSAECARALAVGGLQRLGVDHALSITGIAGPGGGTPEKPVGTVWVGLASRPRGSNGPVRTDVRRFALAGDRSNIREWSSRLALGVLRLHLVGSPDTPLIRQQERVSSA